MFERLARLIGYSGTHPDRLGHGDVIISEEKKRQQVRTFIGSVIQALQELPEGAYLVLERIQTSEGTINRARTIAVPKAWEWSTPAGRVRQEEGIRLIPLSDLQLQLPWQETPLALSDIGIMVDPSSGTAELTIEADHGRYVTFKAQQVGFRFGDGWPQTIDADINNVAWNRIEPLETPGGKYHVPISNLIGFMRSLDI